MDSYQATWKLVTLPFMRMRWFMTLAMLAGLVMAILALIVTPVMLSGVGVAAWLDGMLLGMTLRTLMRTDTLLLPYFRRRLAAAGGIYALAWIGLPALLAVLAGVTPHMLALVATGLLLAMALGISAGTGLRVSMLMWIVFPLFGLLPRSLHASVMHALATSPWIPLLAAVIALFLLEYCLRPMLTASDREDDTSPMQAVADGRKPTGTSAAGTPQRRGLIGKKLAVVLDITARWNLARAVQNFTRKPSAAARQRVIRAVLLPHDNVAGMIVNTLAVIAFVIVYLLLVHGAEDWDAGFTAAYAVVLGLSRFTAIGQGLVKMRPNLADLYMTLGPVTQREFQASMADALLWLIVVTTFNMLAYTVLIAIMLHAKTPTELLLTTLIVGIGAGFSGLAAHLIGPTSKGGRIGVQLVLMTIAVAIYELVLWLMHDFGALVGGLVGIVVCLPIGLGAWHYARQKYLSQRPCFDAPLE